jgi:hypothetical protein
MTGKAKGLCYIKPFLKYIYTCKKSNILLLWQTRPINLYETDQNGNDKLNGVVLEARERLEGRLRASSTVNKRFVE